MSEHAVSRPDPSGPSGPGRAPPAPVNPDPQKWTAMVFAAVFTLTLPAIFTVIVLGQPDRTGRTWSGGGSTAGGASAELTAGAVAFRQSCAVCHGQNGEGVPLLGKPLRNSAFVQSQSDDELLGLLIEGRPVSDPLNTSGVLMPPRGAQGIDDGTLMEVVAHLRSIQDPAAPHVSVSAWEKSSDGDGGTSLAAVELTDHAGYDLFVASCAACHGQGGEGIEGLGLPLTTSGFVRGKSDKDMVTFIKMGRSSWDENNTTGLDMPPKGGNPAITDDQLQLIIEYIRAIQAEAMGT